VEDIKNVLDPKERNKILETIQSTLEQQYPDKKKNIDAILKNPNLDEKQLALIADKIKK